MKTEALTPATSIPIRDVDLDSLFNKIEEWSGKISKRAYELFAQSGFTNGHDLDDWLKAEREFLKPVPLEVRDAGDEFIVRAELPGFEPKDLNVRVNGSHLVIEGGHQGKHETKKDGEVISSEHITHEICRIAALPAPISMDKAHAELKNGILELKLPKAKKTTQIEVTAA